MSTVEHEYIDRGKGEVLMLLHGLFGELSNWQSVLGKFQSKYRVIIPKLPVCKGNKSHLSIFSLLRYVEEFVEAHNLSDLSLMGNSLGGHIALLYALRHPENVRKMILTGSSGLYENAFGGSFPLRKSYEYIKKHTSYIFYDPEVATEEIIQNVLSITRDVNKLLCVVAIAKSVYRHTPIRELYKVKTPTLLIWGLNDTFTPPCVGYDFRYKLENSKLYFIDKCGHVPMMEHPEYFNQLVDDFLEEKQKDASLEFLEL